MASLLLGLAAAIQAVEGNFELAAWMVLWCTLLDKLDGTVARLVGATSKIGTELDSFADFVSFGIAPAALIYFALADNPLWIGNARWALVGSCAVYVVAAAVRLARFNTADPPLGREFFYGLPSTHVAAIITALFLTLDRHANLQAVLMIMPVVLVCCAAAMLGSFLVRKVGRFNNGFLQGLQILIFGSLYVLGPLRLWPEYMLAVGLGLLVIGTSIGAHRRRVMNPG